METETNEIWKDVVGYEGLYMVSNLGRIKSLGNDRTRKDKILNPIKNRNGYLKVSLCKNGKQKAYYIHRLVAQAFVQNDSLFNTDINHKDENPLNNNAENLEWCDRSYNINYGTRNERCAKSNTNNPKRSKKVLCVETGIVYKSVNEVERQTGLAYQSICACCNGRQKSCGRLHWKYAD